MTDVFKLYEILASADSPVVYFYITERRRILKARSTG
jgi:hypothetical protein